VTIIKQFGHIAKTSPEMDHLQALRAAIKGPPAGWRKPRGRPQQTWIQTVETDLRPANVGLHTAWHRAQDHTDWNSLVKTATIHAGVRYYDVPGVTTDTPTRLYAAMSIHTCRPVALTWLLPMFLCLNMDWLVAMHGETVHHSKPFITTENADQWRNTWKTQLMLDSSMWRMCSVTVWEYSTDIWVVGNVFSVILSSHLVNCFLCKYIKKRNLTNLRSGRFRVNLGCASYWWR